MPCIISSHYFFVVKYKIKLIKIKIITFSFLIRILGSFFSTGGRGGGGAGGFRGGRGGGRGGRGGGGGGAFRGGKTVVIEPHRHEGVFIARGKEDALVTLNLVPGSEVYGEKRISVEVISIICYFSVMT